MALLEQALAAGGADERIAMLATLQGGIVRRAQLLALGLSEKAVRHRVKTGRLLPLFRGVYAVGHSALTDRARWRAAVFSTDPSALSHLPAASCLGIAPPLRDVHVSSHRPRQPQPELIVHRATLPASDLLTIDGIVLTNPERTLLDLSGGVSLHRLGTLAREALFQELTDLDRLTAVLERYPRRRRRGDLCRVVDELGFGRGVTRGEFERRFLDFLRHKGLPEPELNVPIVVGGERFVADCLWRAARLVVELDGRPAHSAGHRHDGDTRRDRRLLAVGLATIRVTWSHLARTPDELERDLLAQLERRTRTSASSQDTSSRHERRFAVR